MQLRRPLPRRAWSRSLLTLRLLTHGGTGGIVAAPTTSLPEDFGGERNWDYRYCWLRDASLTLEALLGRGYDEEARCGATGCCARSPATPQDLQIMYAVDGGRDLPERELDHLPGYAGSRPVRIGNGAVDQRQTDVLGEVMVALEMARDAGVEETRDSWSLQRALVDELAEHWDEPDNGLWEIRGPQRHFTHSRVMVWVGLRPRDRGGRGARPRRAGRASGGGCATRCATRSSSTGYDPERNTFTQHYDTDEVDASLLVLSDVGFIDGDDPRMLGTIKAVEEDLMRDGLLLRYRTESGVDGLSGDEHPFLACSFWLVSAYALAGRLDDAHALMRAAAGAAQRRGAALRGVRRRRASGSSATSRRRSRTSRSSARPTSSTGRGPQRRRQKGHPRGHLTRRPRSTSTRARSMSRAFPSGVPTDDGPRDGRRAP